MTNNWIKEKEKKIIEVQQQTEAIRAIKVQKTPSGLFLCSENQQLLWQTKINCIGK